MKAVLAALLAVFGMSLFYACLSRLVSDGAYNWWEQTWLLQVLAILVASLGLLLFSVSIID